MTTRGSGETTRAMLAAPRDAVFVWVDRHLDYPRSLARRLDREDLTIVSPGWLEAERNWIGRTLTDVRLDPEIRLTVRQRQGWYHALSRVRRSV